MILPQMILPNVSSALSRRNDAQKSEALQPMKNPASAPLLRSDLQKEMLIEVNRQV